MNNLIVLDGRVRTDVKIGTKQGFNGSSQKVARFSIPEYAGKDDAGNYKPTKAWYQITGYGHMADKIEKYVTKGSHVIVTGKIRVDAYNHKTDNSAVASVNVTVTDIQVVGGYDSQSQGQPTTYNNPSFNDDNDTASSTGDTGYSYRATTGKRQDSNDSGAGENW
jgi:single-strand DNA-binding protein